MSATTTQHQGRFYGVYLLCSESTEKRFKGKCYIGFTVNPNRRINQHNRGKEFGGAKKTNNKGPWKMAMIVHGFPNNIAALQFEWAWQQPTLSSRLKMFDELKRKRTKETYFEYNFRILSQMLQIGPWCRLPLIIRWLEPAFQRNFEFDFQLPAHMQIVSGAITIKNSSKLNLKEFERTPCSWSAECHLCMQRIENSQRSRIGCLNAFCKLTCHLICLANYMLASDVRNRGHIIPIEGSCPLCETNFSWVALVQHKLKMQGVLGEEDGSDAYETDEEEFDKSFDISSNIDSEDSIPEDILNMKNDIEIYEISD